MGALIEKLGINWQLLIAQIVNFSIVAGVLTYLVYRPILNTIDARRERIRKSIENAARLEEQAKQMANVREDQLKKLDGETGKILAEAKKHAEQMKNEIVEAGQIEAKELLERARKQIESEREKLLSDVQDTVARAIVSLTEKIIRKEFEPADQKRLVGSIIQELPKHLQ